METIFDGIRWIHIVVGFGGLVAFWIPAFSRKGGTTHVRVGRVFEWAAYIVAGSAIFNSVGRLVHALAAGASFDENRQVFGFLIFLAYIGIVTLAAVRHAARAVRLKGDFAAMKTPFHVGLACLSIAGSVVVLAYALFAWSAMSVVFLALSPIGIAQGGAMLSQMRSPPDERMGWFYVHMNNMIGAGIAFHTAFLVFGANRVIPLDLPGLWQVVPWVLPAAIGTPIQRVIEKRYRERFGEPRRRAARESRGAAASA